MTYKRTFAAHSFIHSLLFQADKPTQLARYRILDMVYMHTTPIANKGGLD